MATVREALELNDIPQAELARRSGYTPGQVSRWLNGRDRPLMRTLVILDEAMYELLGDEDWFSPDVPDA